MNVNLVELVLEGCVKLIARTVCDSLTLLSLVLSAKPEASTAVGAPVGSEKETNTPAMEVKNHVQSHGAETT